MSCNRSTCRSGKAAASSWATADQADFAVEQTDDGRRFTYRWPDRRSTAPALDPT